MADAYLAARIQDVREVGARLIRNLTERPYQAFSRLPEDSILIAEEMTPADTAIMDPRRIAGFATAIGGAEGHTAIMARSEEHTSELQSLMRISYAVFCLQKKITSKKID